MHLTYQYMGSISDSDIANVKVEITPKMLEAGVEAYCLWDSGDCPEWAVESIFLSMLQAKAKEDLSASEVSVSHNTQ